MKEKVSETIQIPSGVTCEYKDKLFTCRKDSKELSRPLHIPGVKIVVSADTVSFDCPVATKREFSVIKSSIAHIKNMISGLQNKYVYKLEACNVHFPMTLKMEGDTLIINNFLGEKISRKARILPGVEIEIKGQKITLTSSDKEGAGHTAANIERATKIRNRDRRVFQDGIYIIERPGAK